MNVFYEEDGGFKVGSVLTSTEASLQVEAAHGKRSKIKLANVLLRFERPSLTEFMEQAEAVATDIDISFLWECCGSDEFGFEQLAEDYVGHKPSPIEAAGVAIRLHSAPMYFYRKGKGRYKAAPEETLKAALAGQEKKRLQAEQVARYAEQLARFELPESFPPLVISLLHKPDKNLLEYKALEQACQQLQLSPLRLMERCGALPNAHDYHFQTFLLEYFPKGTSFGDVDVPSVPADLPAADVAAFSLDDSSTTEIDDALSVRPLENGNWQVGVHIAAPALGIEPGSKLDQLVMQRLSTVYFPGNKITMLPQQAVEGFTLQEGRDCPALSMYIELTPDLEVVGTESRIESVHIAANLRNEQLEKHFNDEALAAGTDGDYPFKAELRLLFDFARKLEIGRGKADPNRPPQVDYAFAVDNDRITISKRKRGAPIDKLVSELMIFINCRWGALLAEHNVPGIYRAQSMGRVRMTTSPAPHQGLGVPQYAWSSSPLRRAVDLINQRQLLAILREEPAPYPKGSGELFAAMRDFDVTYNAYLAFQDRMERYWCLRWLEQEQVSEIDAVVLRDGATVRFDSLPFFSKNVIGLPELAPGRKIRLLLGTIDYLGLEIEARFISVATDSVEVLPEADEEDYQTEAAEPVVEEQFAAAPPVLTPTDNADSAPEAV